MSPNPVVLLVNAVNVKKWFATRQSPQEKPRGRFEHLDEPVPGYYEYRPGRGLLLVALDEDDGHKLDQPIPVIYSKLLHRNFLEPEYKSRQKHGYVLDENDKKKVGTFFRMDDGFTWVYWRDQYGQLDASPRRRKYCIDADTGKFRPMTSADCIIDGQGTSIASPSIKGSVEGDVHRASTRSSISSSPSATRPSTKPSTRRNSSLGAGLRQLSTQTSPSTIASAAGSQHAKLDGAELDQRLRDLSKV